MVIHVVPAPIPGVPLALTNELNSLRFQNRITALLAWEDQEESTNVAREWAQRCGIPVIDGKRPDLVVVASSHLDGCFEETITNPAALAKDAWKQVLERVPPEKGFLKPLLECLRTKKTLWVNTTNDSYRTHPEYQKRIGSPT